MKEWRRKNMSLAARGLKNLKIRKKQVSKQFTFINQIPSALLMALLKRVK